MENPTLEFIEKAKSAKSVDEVVSLAKEFGANFTEEEMKELYKQLHDSGILSDEDVSKVAGG